MKSKDHINTESLADYYYRLSELYRSGKLQEIHSSKNLPYTELDRTDQFSVKFLPVDFSNINRLYMKNIRAGFKSVDHMHDSPTFRYILSGKVAINGEAYSSGDWILVPKLRTYSFEVLEDCELIYMCDHETDWFATDLQSVR